MVDIASDKFGATPIVALNEMSMLMLLYIIEEQAAQNEDIKSNIPKQKKKTPGGLRPGNGARTI